MHYYTYLEALAKGFPGVECHTTGDGSIYEDIIWDSGLPLPSKDALDIWIAANPYHEQIILTKFEFRQLFTFEERVGIDNAVYNMAIDPQIRAAVNTMLSDLSIVEFVDLSTQETISAVNMLESFGFIAAGRATQILANTPPVV